MKHQFTEGDYEIFLVSGCIALLALSLYMLFPSAHAQIESMTPIKNPALDNSSQHFNGTRGWDIPMVNETIQFSIPQKLFYNGTGLSVDASIHSTIPSWVKNIFIWYGEGNISDDQLIKALQYLISSGIIKV